MKGWLTIGRLAAETGVSPDTLRYYESVGLLPAPARSRAGYRLYSRAEVRRLQLIKRAKLLGLSLQDIKDLVDQTFTGSCTQLQHALLERIPGQVAEIDRRIADLAALKGELAALQRQLINLDSTAVQGMVAERPFCPVVEGTPTTVDTRVAQGARTNKPGGGESLAP
jgi:DNA-binding transcriptional MerR regulator